MKKLLSFLLYVIVTISLTGCPPNNCNSSVDFESPLVVGTTYGQSTGSSAGTQLFTNGNIQVTGLEFTTAGGNRVYNYAAIESSPSGFTSTQVMRLNNISVHFFFGSVGFPVSEVSFEYLDLGGSENLSTGAFNFAGEITDAPNAVTAQQVIVTSSTIPGGKKGTVTIKGTNIDKVVIGGQEFWIDNLCVK